MKKAYVLINCDLGKEADIQDTIRSIKEAHGTFGAYGIIAVTTKNPEQPQEDITWKILGLLSIKSILTLVGTGNQF